MIRKRFLFILLFAIPGLANGLGLGNIELNSGLNQPLNARVELLSATADELQNLHVGLADSDAFRRARIDRLFILSNLRFQVEQAETGPDYILVTSQEPIREPFLNFLIEASWSKGRIFREYTVLLDPPMYDLSGGRGQLSEPSTADYEPVPEPVEEYVADDVQEQYEEPVSVTTTVDSDEDYPAEPISSGEYGPTSSSDTLWSIAGNTRPDNSVSIQQMMLALQRANPEAFLDNNINGLKRGQILRVPDRDEVMYLSAQEALAEVKSQYSLWEETRGAIAASALDRPVSAEVDDDYVASSVTETEEDSSELRLVAASEEGIGTIEGDTADTGMTTGADTGEALTLANEELEAISQENLELKDRLAEAEGIIDDLKRLIALKDDELASIQQQIATGEMPDETEPADVEEDILADEVLDDDFEEEADDFGVDQVEEEEYETDLAGEGEEEETEVEDTVATVPPVVEPVAPPAGLVDQVKNMVMDNLLYVAGGIGALILIAGAAVFVSRRKRKAAHGDKAVSAVAEFPDFEQGSSGSEDETIIPGEETDAPAAEPDSEAVTELPVAEDADSGAGEFVETVQDVAAVEEAPPAAAAEEPEEDPLAEVNVFLAYEHFDQAEEFVRNAITGDPDNLDFHGKLLEIFYAAGNKSGYEEAARELHDKVNGEGPHWEMAQAMWSELSPNRALFEAPAAGEEDSEEEEDTAAEITGGGMLDITAEEAEQTEAADAGLDFDIGAGDTGEAAETAGSDEAVLDLTAGQDENVLDVTAAVSGDAADEDLLDVTAAVGLETEQEAAMTGEDEDMLDITSDNIEEGPDDILDISQGGGEDLLDVTAHTDLGSDDIDEDLLDVTAATGAGADADELLEINEGDEAADGSDDENALDFDIGGGLEETPAADEGTLELDVGGLETEATEDEQPVEDNVIDFDTGGANEVEEDGGLDLSIGDTDTEIELDLSMDMEESGGDDDLSAGLDTETETMAIELDDSDSATDGDSSDGLEIDLSIDDGTDDQTPSLEVDNEEEQGAELDLTLDDGTPDIDDLSATIERSDLDELQTATEELSDDGGIELDLEIDTDAADGAESLDMDSTVEMPKLDIEMDDDDEEAEDATVFVPRSADAEEQSEEDEIATKLDLAKAYVELGDKDSAKSILEEVIEMGNDQQRQQAQELLGQVN